MKQVHETKKIQREITLPSFNSGEVKTIFLCAGHSVSKVRVRACRVLSAGKEARHLFLATKGAIAAELLKYVLLVTNVPWC